MRTQGGLEHIHYLFMFSVLETESRASHTLLGILLLTYVLSSHDSYILETSQAWTLHLPEVVMNGTDNPCPERIRDKMCQKIKKHLFIW